MLRFQPECFSSRREPRDFLSAVTQRPENLVILGGRRAAKEGLTKQGIDVFPEDLSLVGHYKKIARRKTK